MLDIIASTLHCPIEILLLQTVLPRWLLLVLISYITLRFGDGNHIDMVFVAPSASSGCFWLFFSPPVSQEDENWLRSKYFTTAIPPTGKPYETTGHGKNSISTSILELGQCFFLLCIYRKIHIPWRREMKACEYILPTSTKRLVSTTSTSRKKEPTVIFTVVNLK